MPSREEVDDVLQRVGLAAISYYPEIHVDEPDYTVDGDVDWCLEPVTDLTDEQRKQLRNCEAVDVAEEVAEQEPAAAEPANTETDTDPIDWENEEDRA